MQIIVQKFGGTSVATEEVRQLVVKKVQQALKEGFTPVVVVSAMGRKGAPYATDTLLSLLKETNERTEKKEIDSLLCCGEIISAAVMAATLQGAGVAATMLTGGQAGIITDNHFTNARIIKIDSSKILHLLQAGRVPVVCGFQGVTVDGDFTTLGRGGSDTTGAALGAALNAEAVEIYTDVDGIMTADPRIVEDARILDCISYSEVCQMAHQGAKVIHPRAVEIAMQKNIPLIVKSTFSDAPGTLITSPATSDSEASLVTDRIATGVTYLEKIVQIALQVESTASHQTASQVFHAMANNNISVDLINVHPGQIMFTVNAEVASLAEEKLVKLGFPVTLLPDCAKVSVVGGGMREVPGVMASFVDALTCSHVEILQTVDSHTSISALIHQADVKTALLALHGRFGLAD
ncbi:aspartate kinase [Sporomusaceae bacterium BoRhaA]|uniref:aspartate kinase n=1 Tax=Pelorhabdus rhamnosifermentans TaxID=2772457 RepID=UPI001C05FC54|nr:aspartate kinase [Pelorhabdus rhamnosifermentans]MBU2701944.1 aspartate kinase [Pelorhabdus rhamnosifermentans]